MDSGMETYVCEDALSLFVFSLKTFYSHCEEGNVPEIRRYSDTELTVLLFFCIMIPLKPASLR